MTPTTLTGPAASPDTRSQIPAVYAVPVTVEDGTTHLVADDVYTVAMVLQGHRPFTTLCDTKADHHAAATTPAIQDCIDCLHVADSRGLRRSRRAK